MGHVEPGELERGRRWTVEAGAADAGKNSAEDEVRADRSRSDRDDPKGEIRTVFRHAHYVAGTDPCPAGDRPLVDKDFPTRRSGCTSRLPEDETGPIVLGRRSSTRRREELHTLDCRPLETRPR